MTTRAAGAAACRELAGYGAGPVRWYGAGPGRGSGILGRCGRVAAVCSESGLPCPGTAVYPLRQCIVLAGCCCRRLPPVHGGGGGKAKGVVPVRESGDAVV